MVTLLTQLVMAWRETGGAFDPTLLPAVVAAGYEASWDDPTRRTSLPAGLALRGRARRDHGGPFGRDGPSAAGHHGRPRRSGEGPGR